MKDTCGAIKMIITNPEQKFIEKIYLMEDKLRLMHKMISSKNIDIEQFEECFNVIIWNVDGYINYTRLRPRNFDNKTITWKNVQYSDNYHDKFIFAQKVFLKFLERFKIIKDNTESIRTLINLGHYLEIITNINNLYFTLTQDEALNKVFNSQSKTFNTIFKEDMKFLAYDYRKFTNIDKFSEENSSNISEDSIRITQEEGLKLYDIGELIYNFKLEEAMNLLYSSIDSKKLPLFG